MKDRQVPAWIGALTGVVAAAALTWVLNEGSRALALAVRVQQGSLASAGWLLVAAGILLVAVLWGASLHPLVTGVPAAWFLLRFGPSLVGIYVFPTWYPTWLQTSVLEGLGDTAFVITGILLTATLLALARRRSTSRSLSQVEAVHH